MKFLKSCLAAASLPIVFVLMMTPLLSKAQTYPTKTIRFIVPFAPGGNTDVAARLVAKGLSQQMGQPIIVENRAGAGGVIGTDFVAKAPADGYIVLVGHIGALTINPAIYEKLPYDTLKDFDPVGLSVVTPLVLVSASNVGINSVAELIKKAKSDPGKLTYGTAGSGSAAHMASELFNISAGIQTTHIPYKGAGPATLALLSGEVSYSFGGQAPTQPFVKSGKLIALGVSGLNPSPQFPGVPTLASLGLKDFEVVDWSGLLVPAGTPKSIVSKLNVELIKYLNLPETKTQLSQLGFEGRPGTPGQFTEFIKSEMVKWKKSADTANIKAD